jgi:hypothetical protein
MTFTYRPTCIRITPLDADGNPAGPGRELHGVRSISINTQPKENTAMPVLPDIPTGWTKAKIWERYQQLLADRDQLQLDHDDLAAQLADEDHEARALGQCINALDAMLVTDRSVAEAQARNRGNSYGTAVLATRHTTAEHRPPALDSPVGRILLHLAARYEVDVVAPHPPLPDEPETLAAEGQALLVVPERLANSIQQLVNEQPWAIEEVGRR